VVDTRPTADTAPAAGCEGYSKGCRRSDLSIEPLVSLDKKESESFPSSLSERDLKNLRRSPSGKGSSAHSSQELLVRVFRSTIALDRVGRAQYRILIAELLREVPEPKNVFPQ